MIPVTVTYETETGEFTTATYRVEARTVWAAINLGRLEFIKEHGTAKVHELCAVGPK